MVINRLTLIALISFTLIIPVYGQFGQHLLSDDYVNQFSIKEFENSTYQNQKYSVKFQSPIKKDTVPEPGYVLMRSLIVPGWGQIINEQSWKVPIVYGALIGVGYYSYWLDSQYRDFRAAYYNSFAATNADYTDEKFGKTPSRLANAPQTALKYYRNYYRNERDFMLLMFALTYGLNVIDAYIYAQLKDFDVSDDFTVQALPYYQGEGKAGAQISVSFTF